MSAKVAIDARKRPSFASAEPFPPASPAPGRSARTGRRSQLSDEVADYVRDLILTKQLRPGEFVRQERIAEELHMSCTPVREGLLALRGEGIVELEPRRGFRVASPSADDLRDLFAAQALLGGELAARAALLIEDDQLEELVAIEELLAGATELADIYELEVNFHRGLNAVAQAPMVVWLFNSATLAVPYPLLPAMPAIPGWKQASARNRAAILVACRVRDAEGARRAMVAHFELAGRLLLEGLEELVSS